MSEETGRSPTETNRKPPSKDARPNPAVGWPEEPFTYGRVSDGVLALPQTTAFVDGMVLYSMSLHEHAGGYRAILKAKRRGGFYVAFVNQATWQETLKAVLFLAESGVLPWWRDKYPPK